MADSTTTSPLDTGASGNNGTIQFTFEEQLLAYSALYSMSLLCILLGSLRSLKFVQDHISKKELLETSITTKEAKKFPITASLVLFTLYLVFKTNDNGVDFFLTKAKPYLPPATIEKAEFVLTNYVKPWTASATNLTDTATNKTTDAVNLATNKTSTILHRIASYHPYLDQSISYLPEFNKNNLIFVLLLLLCWEGCTALSIILKPVFSFFLSHLPIGNRWPRRNVPYLFCLKRGKKDVSEMKEQQLEKASKKESEYLLYGEFDTHLLISFVFCSFVGISHLARRHWITNDLLGIAFSIYGIENLHLASFKAGVILLSGLFIYDVFWVFATDVMTTVAKGIDAPILLQFPQDLLRNGWLDASKHGMLGLGDIVIPGIFIALLYRFDNYIGSPKYNPKDKTAKPPKARFYCWITIFAYALGLLITMGVMHYFKAAQPALLYLVPTCILIPLSVAVIRGEFKAIWNYSEEQFVEKDEKEKPSETTKEKKNK